MDVYLFFLIIFPLGIPAVVDRPNWNEAEWEKQLENFARKYPPVEGGPDDPISIPELIECALNLPKKFPTCSDTFRTALLNEVLLRKQFKDHKEDCNSHGTKESDLILNAPIRVDKLNLPLYSEWQEKLINSKLGFCDPHTFLRCSAEKKCVCLSKSVRVGNICIYSHNSPCTRRAKFFIRNSTGQLYFDPFERDNDKFTLRQQIAPGCQEKEESCEEVFYDTYHRELGYCVDVESDAMFNRWPSLSDYFHNLRPLPVNEKCNIKDHNRLFTSTKEEDDNFEVRLKTVEEIKGRGVRFCDLEAFLTCGPSEKCECMATSSEKDGKCVLPDQMDKCEVDLTMEPILMNKTLVPIVREELMRGFVNIMSVNACEGQLICHSEMMEMYCTCPSSTTGVNCGDRLTRFLPIVRVPSLPTDVEGYPAKIKFFSEFNQKVLEFEKNMNLGEGDVCVWKFQNEFEMLVERIRRLMYRGTNMTQSDYDSLSNDLTQFRHQVCSPILSLRCQYSSKKCVRQTRQSHLQDLRNELEKSKTLKCRERGCSQFPIFDDLMFGGDENDFFGGKNEIGFYKIIKRHSELLNSNAKFCADGGSCSGGTPGTCVCQVVDQKNKINKSFAHFARLPNDLILLFSVATFFVVSNC